MLKVKKFRIKTVCPMCKLAHMEAKASSPNVAKIERFNFKNNVRRLENALTTVPGMEKFMEQTAQCSTHQAFDKALGELRIRVSQAEIVEASMQGEQKI